MRAGLVAGLTLGLTLGLALLPGCSWLHRPTDAERAAKERAEVREELQSSYVVMPYRGLKTVIRGSALEPPKPELVELVALSNEIMTQLDAINAASSQPDYLAEAARVGRLIAALYRAGSILSKEDEDRYPTIWQAAKAGPLPAVWYDAQAEHALVGTVDLLLHAAARRQPVLDWVYYEFDRAPVQPGWPLDLKLLAQQGRGLMYLLGDKHYAAEEELSAYLLTLTSMSEAERRTLGTKAGPLNDGERVHKGLRALGHLSRSLNRFALKRDDPGYDDLEAAVKQIRELGVDNELTDWGELTLTLHRGNYARASQLLEHLAQSPYLSEEERLEVKQCATSMKQLGGGFVLFGRDRALLVLGRALLARIGGIKTVLATLSLVIGPERAALVARPLLLLWATGSMMSTDAEAQAHETVDKGKKLGKQGYDYLRDKAKKLKD